MTLFILVCVCVGLFLCVCRIVLRGDANHMNHIKPNMCVFFGGCVATMLVGVEDQSEGKIVF